MKTAINYVFLLIIFSILTGCKKNLSKRDYVKFIQSTENGLKKTIEIDNWHYSIQFKPYDYILLMEQTGVNERTKRLEQLKGTAWFNISFMRSDGNVSPMRYNLNSKDEYDLRVNYFLNEASKEIQMIFGGKDTLKPIAYEFENNYNLTPQETMVVGFKLPEGTTEPNKDMQLVYHDALFKNGIIKVIITSGTLKNIPNLTL